jgi:hypothetical protein
MAPVSEKQRAWRRHCRKRRERTRVTGLQVLRREWRWDSRPIHQVVDVAASDACPYSEEDDQGTRGDGCWALEVRWVWLDGLKQIVAAHFLQILLFF